MIEIPGPGSGPVVLDPEVRPYFTSRSWIITSRRSAKIESNVQPAQHRLSAYAAGLTVSRIQGSVGEESEGQGSVGVVGFRCTFFKAVERWVRLTYESEYRIMSLYVLFVVLFLFG
ncbi:hypothetical protein FPOAC2_09067 [Fusarium poae]|jgi:hypothetical protein